MHKINILLLLVIVVSIASAAYAEAAVNFKTSISPETAVLPNLDQRVEFTLEIKNEEPEEVHYRISTIDPRWVIQSDPLTHMTSGVKIPPRTSVFTKLYVSLADEQIRTGTHEIKLQIRPKDDSVMKEQAFLITIPEESERVYEPAIKTVVTMDEEFDPRDELRMSIKLKNQNPLNVKDLVVRIRSDSKDGPQLLNEEYTTSLKPVGENGDEKTIIVTKELDDRMEPVNDTIRVTLVYEGEIIEPTIPPEKISITSYSEIIEEKDVDEKFLRKTTAVSYINDGNVRDSGASRIPTNWFKNLFTETSPEARIIKDEAGMFYYYEYHLKPDETFSYKISTNYIPAAVIVTLVILIFLAYFIFRSPIIIKKTIRNVHKSSDGLAVVKVQLQIKNRSAMTLEEIRVMDKIPSIAELVKVFHIGTLEPSKITSHEKSGTSLKWEIDEIERFEERLIVYKIKTKLAVVGGFTLPPMVVRFKTPRGEIRRVRSKPVPVKI